MRDNIYLILFVLLVLCVIIIFTKNQKKVTNQEEPFVESIGELIDTSMITEDSLNTKMLITRLDVIKVGEDPNFPNKHILI